MILKINSLSIFVLNLERAINFYVSVLGFHVHTEMLLENKLRWVSIYLPENPELQLMLIPVEKGPLFTGRQAIKMRELIHLRFFSCGVFQCKDLMETYNDLKLRGVRFIAAPGPGFLGQYEAAFLDDSGNWFRLSQDGLAV